MTARTSLLLCGTPRTGSTLLCRLLESTQVAGRPESYFREPDERLWAQRFGLAAPDEPSFEYRAFVAAAIRAGSTPNGVFAARIMWGTIARLVSRLGTSSHTKGDVQVLQEAFGPLVMVHITREDVVGQAVSWARAEQTGYWQEGDTVSASPLLDLQQIDALVGTIHEHNSAWQRWFSDHGAVALPVSYEDVVTRPRSTVERILTAIGAEVPGDWEPAPSVTRQADELSAHWVRSYLNR